MALTEHSSEQQVLDDIAAQLASDCDSIDCLLDATRRQIKKSSPDFLASAPGLDLKVWLQKMIYFKVRMKSLRDHAQELASASQNRAGSAN